MTPAECLFILKKGNFFPVLLLGLSPLWPLIREFSSSEELYEDSLRQFVAILLLEKLN